MKMGKKVREYKSGDFIFAKVKGYPAWPARVQRMNGKKYFVYFYGTGETANLPPNMIFDYAENKDKFLTKTVKRKDFNDGVRQIEHDFANNVPLEQVIGVAIAEPGDTTANDTANETANDTMDDTSMAETTADETIPDGPAENKVEKNDGAVEDSDETGALVIDEGKKGRKSKAEPAKPPAKETPAKPIKEPKTPRGKAKKEETKSEQEEEKKEEELVSRSGRKIRPKRYIDEQTEENATLPSPAPKKRRTVSPSLEKEKEKEKDKLEPVKEKSTEKNNKHYNAVTQTELEDLKEPFTPEDAEKENILIAYLPSGQYIGVKLFQSRPSSFKNEAARLQWDKQAASNAVTLKMQLEKGQITPQSVSAQLEMELNLTDEEKATLDKEREIEEKKSRVQFLKTEMKLIELDVKIKTCLSLKKADTDLCLKLLDELMELDVKPLMLLKHPTCLETVKRMRAYVGNTPSWDLSESAALVFSKQAHRIRKQADTLYRNMKELFITPEGLSFWEYFSERVLQFKKVTAKFTSDELLEMVHEPLEMSMPTSHTMKAAIDAANEEELPDEDEIVQKKKSTPVKPKKAANSTPSKAPIKRQSSRKLQQEEKEKETNKKAEENAEEQPEENKNDNEKELSKDKKSGKEESTEENKLEKDVTSEQQNTDVEMKDSEEKEEEMEVDKKEDGDSKDKEKDSKSPKESGDAKASGDEKGEEVKDKEKQENEEPRAKRSRENKKTEPPTPRSPAKRKSKS